MYPRRYMKILLVPYKAGHRWIGIFYINLTHKNKTGLEVMSLGAIWWGARGTCPPLFQTGGTEYAMFSHFFLFRLGFRFCIWRGFKNKSDVCDVLCEELFMLDGKPYTAKLMLKQCLVWYQW